MSAQGQHKTSFTTPLASNESAAKEPVGAIRYENGKKYKYILFSSGTGTIASAANAPVGYLATNTGLTTACTDYSDCFVALLAGLLVAALTTAYYGWMQIGGLSGVIPVDVAGSPAAGEGVQLSDDKTVTKYANADIGPKADVVDVTSSAMLLYLYCLE